MQDDINNIDKPDVFSEFIRQKLENHQLPVDQRNWSEIEDRMKEKKRRIIPFWFWLSGGAVAVLALLFTLLPLTQKTTNTTIIISSNSHQKIQPRQVNNFNSNQIKQTEDTKIKPLKHKIYKQTISKPGIYIPINESISNNGILNKLGREFTDNNLKKDETVAMVTEEKKDSVIKEKRYIPNSLIEELVNNPIVKNKKRSEWLLAASFGSGGGLPNGNYGNELASFDKNIVNTGTNYTSLMSPKDFSKITYNSPLSFGVVVRKKLDKTISLESGLVYTYLLTNFDNNGVQQNNARLHLHYIGIPLNLVGLVWQNQKWEIYFSGGPMVEKGIRSVYVQNQIYGNQTFTTTAATNIAGFQWSLNGAVGITYRFQQNLGIFFEPKLACYFDNNQPISSRTDQPLAIGLTAGLRLQIK